MKNRECRRFVGFVVITIALLLMSISAALVFVYLIFHGNFGGIYWGIIFPIYWYLILMILVLAIASYFASWIYFAKSKGYPRWFGMFSIAPIIGPLILIGLKNKSRLEPEDSYPIVVAQIVAIIVPVIILLSVPPLLSSIDWEKDIIKQNVIKKDDINNLY